ncbi:MULTISPECIES: hypothetical protein [Calothrix]|uniref:Uncharacterized protein n=2 Tax=Calothrix TaxID=1186 RepID=A0ABR8AGD3_9CYAN|nr:MULTISPECIES: hypothetical protein [Calothrix]MBD2198978.1 hypothetical protein [Calothrix parietina FACHB-288]MBD2227680.1 hypothetical protein [Calothrix anomala FACHB-343]
MSDRTYVAVLLRFNNIPLWNDVAVERSHFNKIPLSQKGEDVTENSFYPKRELA